MWGILTCTQEICDILTACRAQGRNNMLTCIFQLARFCNANKIECPLRLIFLSVKRQLGEGGGVETRSRGICWGERIPLSCFCYHHHHHHHHQQHQLYLQGLLFQPRPPLLQSKPPSTFHIVKGYGTYPPPSPSPSPIPPPTKKKKKKKKNTHTHTHTHKTNRANWKMN